MKLLLVNQVSGSQRIPRRWLERWTKELGRALGKQKLELVIVFIDSREMRRLNLQYRKKAYATDVLSFSSGDPTCIGELVLCLPVLQAQARRFKVKPRAEIGLMVVHGVLHLLGYDHEGDNESLAAEMFELQDKVFHRLEERVGYR